MNQSDALREQRNQPKVGDNLTPSMDELNIHLLELIAQGTATLLDSACISSGDFLDVIEHDSGKQQITDPSVNAAQGGESQR